MVAQIRSGAEPEGPSVIDEPREQPDAIHDDPKQPDATKLKHVRVFCRGEIFPRETWSRIKPTNGDIIEVRAFPVPLGGDGGGLEGSSWGTS
jgi:hypothetical protein